MPYAMQIARTGGPEVFERVDVPRPAPGPGSCWCAWQRRD